MRIVFFVLLAIALNTVVAVDTLSFANCENLGLNECDGFRQLDMDIDEQKSLFSSLLEQNRSMHDFIFDWNTNLVFNQTPDGLLPRNHKSIRNAWLIVSAVMPSVLYDNILYNNYSGNVQTNFGYDLTRPPTYFNGLWETCSIDPPRYQGDCRTEHLNNWDESRLIVYLNNGLIGDSALTPFQTSSEDNTFSALLKVVNKIETKHYSWREGDCCNCNTCCYRCGINQRCCGKSCAHCGCEANWQICEENQTSYTYDELALLDSMQSRLESPSYSNNSILYDNYTGTAYLLLNTSGIVYYELKLDDLRLRKDDLALSYTFSYPPANILTSQATNISRLISNAYSELYSGVIEFQLNDPEYDTCEIELYSFFGKQSLGCNITVLPETGLNTTTDKFFYYPDEPIKANITIGSSVDTSEDLITVTYGNATKKITGGGQVDFVPQANINQIKARFDTDLTHSSTEAAKTVSIYSGTKPRYYVTIFWIIIGFFGFASALRSCWRKFYDHKHVVLGDN
ncbi:MAG: hypothetical protein ABH879_05070 [archaeon]